MNMWLFQCNDFEHVLEPDDGHIGLKHVVWKKTVNCECVKVTDKDQQDTYTHFKIYYISGFQTVLHHFHGWLLQGL
jgi:hypothetical protein